MKNTTVKSIIAFALFFFFFSILNCKRDILTDDEYLYSDASAKVPPAPLTIEAAEECFKAKQNDIQFRTDNLTSDSIRQYLSRIEPLWDFADTIFYQHTIPIIAVPVAIDEEVTINKHFMVVFFVNEQNAVDSRLFFIYADSTYTDAQSFTENFTGYVLQMDWNGHIVHSLRFDQGFISGSVIQQGNVQFRTEPVTCADGSEPIVIYGSFPIVGNLIIYICGIEPGGNSQSLTADPFGLGGNGEGNSGGGNSSTGNGSSTGGGGGSSSNITNYFDPNDFEGFERKNAQKINQFKSKYNLVTSAPALLSQIIDQCNLSSDPEILFGELLENLSGSLPTCVKGIIIQDRITALLDEGIVITEGVLVAILGIEGMLSPNAVDEIIKLYNTEWFNSPPPEQPIVDIAAAIDNCFKDESECPNCTYSVTIYVEQPVPGTRNIYTGGGGSSGSGKNGGHTFLSLDQNDLGQGGSGLETTMTFGFYPTTKPSGQETVPGFFFYENQSTEYNISVTYSISRTQFETIKNTLGNMINTYQAGYANCATNAIIPLREAGINIPMTPRWQWPIGDLDANPADLGEDLRANPQGGYFFSTSGNEGVAPPLSTCN